MMEKGKEEVVHIYSQESWHREAAIFGNKAGLLSLKKAIEDALESDEKKGNCILMPADQENFICKVVLNDESFESPFWQKLKDPYAELTDDDESKINPIDYIDYGVLNSGDLAKAQKKMDDDRIYSEKITNEMIKKISKGKNSE